MTTRQEVITQFLAALVERTRLRLQSWEFRTNGCFWEAQVHIESKDGPFTERPLPFTSLYVTFSTEFRTMKVRQMTNLPGPEKAWYHWELTETSSQQVLMKELENALMCPSATPRPVTKHITIEQLRTAL